MQKLFSQARTSGVAAILCGISLSGCQTNIKPFEPVKSAESFCRHGEPKRSSILSIMSSLSDTQRPAPSRTTKSVYAHVRSVGGVVAHWDDLNVLLPATARLYGDADGYLHVVAAAFDNPSGEANSRNIQILIQQPKGQSWHEFQAFDVQNVCVEGTRQN